MLFLLSRMANIFSAENDYNHTECEYRSYKTFMIAMTSVNNYRIIFRSIYENYMNNYEIKQGIIDIK